VKEAFKKFDERSIAVCAAMLLFVEFISANLKNLVKETERIISIS